MVCCYRPVPWCPQSLWRSRKHCWYHSFHSGSRSHCPQAYCRIHCHHCKECRNHRRSALEKSTACSCRIEGKNYVSARSTIATRSTLACAVGLSCYQCAVIRYTGIAAGAGFGACLDSFMTSGVHIYGLCFRGIIGSQCIVIAGTERTAIVVDTCIFIYMPCQKRHLSRR